jgi:hypothetical protein
MAWLGRLLLIIAILALLPLLRRILVGFFTGLLGGPQSGGSRRPRARCPRCNGSGWIAAPAGMKKACSCGIVPPEGRGPIIDVGDDRRSDSG